MSRITEIIDFVMSTPELKRLSEMVEDVITISEIGRGQTTREDVILHAILAGHAFGAGPEGTERMKMSDARQQAEFVEKLFSSAERMDGDHAFYRRDAIAFGVATGFRLARRDVATPPFCKQFTH